MKKIISYLLIFVISLTTSPIRVFAQEQGYRPASSFEYEFYEVGQISPKMFISKLEDDLLNYEDYWDPDSVPPVSRKLEGNPEHLRQSYNDFMYYNIHPEESPYWSYTGLIPGNGTAAVDVLRILDKHHTLSEQISEEFQKSKKFKHERLVKNIRLIPVYLILIALFLFLWEFLLPEITSIAAIASCGKAVAVIIKAAAGIAILAADIYLSDQVTHYMYERDPRLVSAFEYVSSYRNSAIKVSLKTDLLKSVKETEYDEIQDRLKQMSNNRKWWELPSNEELMLKRYFKRGYASIDDYLKMDVKRTLGKFLYDLFDGDEVLINEYFRKEMLRTYYALEFILDELKNEDDPLRYERAMIDLATTYKIQNIQVIDGRVFGSGKTMDRSVLEKNFTDDMISSLNFILEKRSVSTALLTDHLGSKERATNVLNSLQARGIITKHDLGGSAYMWDIDFNLAEEQLSNLKEFSKRKAPPEVRSFAQNLQHLQSQSCNLNGNTVNSPVYDYINQEIERQIGAELDDQTSTYTTYPTMLTRAEVNYLVQIMDIHEKKKAYDENMRREIRNREYVESRVRSREAQMNVTPDGWGWTK